MTGRLTFSGKKNLLAITSLSSALLTLAACSGAGSSKSTGTKASPSSSSSPKASNTAAAPSAPTTPAGQIAIKAPAVVNPPLTPYTSRQLQMSLTGNCDKDTLVKLSGDLPNQDAPCATDGQFAMSVVAPADGTYNLSLVSIAANAQSEPSVMSWTVDSTSPVAPIITGPTSTGAYSSNGNNVTLAGSCETGSTVNLSGDAAQAFSCAAGTFQFDYPSTTNGTYNFTLTQTDGAGNGSAQTAFAWTRNVVVPTAPVITLPSAATLHTRGNTLTISGTCLSGDTIGLAGGASQAMTCASGLFSFDVGSTTDGSLSYTVSATDAFGNTVNGSSVSWVRDTMVPAAPAIINPSTSPYSSSNSMLSVSGGCEAGANVAWSGAAVGSTTCSMGGSFAFSVNKPADGDYDFAVVQTDLAGNVSPATHFRWTRSSAAPAAPTLAQPSSSPYLSNGPSLTIAGGCVSGNTVSISGVSGSEVTGGQTSVACASNAYSFTVAKASEGTFNFGLQQTSGTGVQSATTTQQWVRDTSAPAAPVLSSPSSTGTYGSNGTSILISGACETDATVKLAGDATQSTSCAASAFSFTVNESADGTYNFLISQTDAATNVSADASLAWTRSTAAPAAPVIAQPTVNPAITNSSLLTISGSCASDNTVTLSGGASQSMACVGNAFSFDVSASSDNTYNYSVAQADAFGNSSGNASQQWVRDTAAPSAPSIATPSTTGSYASNGNFITLSGVCEASATVHLSGAVSQTAACSSGAYSFTINQSSDGAYALNVTQTDLAGNASSASSLTWTRNTVVPAAPVIAQPASSPAITNGNSLAISGSCASGNAVNLSGDSTQATICAAGAFSVVSNQSADGEYHMTLTQRDAFGNVSPAASLTWERDTDAPDAPTITSPSATGTLSSNQNTISLGGACEAGATINLSGDDVQSTPCSGAGAYSFTIAETSDGTFNYDVTQTDAATNASTATSYTWTRNTAPPAAPLISSPATTPVYTNGNALVLSGTCLTGATVTLSGASTQTASCPSGSFSFNVSQSSDGTYNLAVAQADAYGNNSAATTVQWIRDTVDPNPPTITSPSTSGTYGSSGDAITLAGACEAGATVNLTGAATQSVACTSNAYSFTISQTTDGVYNLSVVQLDRAGNDSDPSAFVWTRDTSAPATPIVSSPATSPVRNNASSLTIAGSCVNGYAVHLTGNSTQNATCTGGNFSFSVTASIDNNYSYSLTQTNPIGTSSAAVAVQWVRDTMAPATVTLNSPSANPYVSSDTTIQLAGVCENGATVSYSGALTGSIACASGAFAASLTKTVDASYSINVVQTDQAGNASAPLEFEWTLDTTIPTTPGITAPSANPHYSHGNSITLTGTCTNGNTVALSGVTGAEVAGGNLEIACSGGSYSYVINKSVDGTYNLDVIQVDTAENESAAASIAWTRDTGVPAAPTITSPATSPYTSSGNLTLAGSCEVGATLALTGDSTQSVSCDTGSYGFSVTKSMDGTYNFSLAQTDRAGNTSSSVSQQWVRDNSTPATPTITTPSSSPYLSNSTTLTMSGGCVSGNTVTLTGATAGEVVTPAGSLTQVCAANAYSYVISKSSDSTYPLAVTQTSSAGIPSGAASLSWKRDTTAPTVTLATKPSDPNLSSTGVFTFSGTDAMSTFTLQCSLDSAAYSTCTSPVTYTAMTNGSHTFNVRATDAAGNVSTEQSYTWAQAAYNTLALYHFDSGAVNTDSSNYLGAYKNSLTSNTGTNSTPATPKFAQAERYTSASSQYGTVAHTATQALISGTMTIDVWIYVGTLPSSYQTIVSKNGSSSGNYGWEFGITRSSSSYYMYFRGCAIATGCTSSPSVKRSSSKMSGFTTNTWYHLAMTYNKGAVKYYFKGAANGTASVGSNVNLYVPTSQPMQVGRTGTGTYYFNSTMDELRISQNIRWSTAFTPPTAAYTAD